MRLSAYCGPVGVLVGFMFIQPTDFQDFQTHLALLMDEFEVSMPEFPALDLPQLDLSRVEVEWRRLWQNIPEPWKLANNGLEFTVGEAMAARGLSAKHPVILVPGIISTVSPVESHIRRTHQYCINMRNRDWNRGLRLPTTGLSSARNYGADSR